MAVRKKCGRGGIEPLYVFRRARQQIENLVKARLAQSVERKALNLVVVGSSPTVGVFSFVLLWAEQGPQYLLCCVITEGVSTFHRLSLPFLTPAPL